MLRACFISDIHIASPESVRARLFLSFLKALSGGSNVTHLFLLGDIFDLWVADHRFFVDRYREIVDEIARLRNEGMEISYFEGNHDLHLRYFWEDQLGIAVHDGPVNLRLGDMAVRLEHGDQMDPDDRGYVFLRWFLRTPPVRFLLCRLPGPLVSRIGDRASAKSRVYTSSTKSIEPKRAIEKVHAHAGKAYAKEPFDLIVSGHVHVRDDSQVVTETGSFRSVNLGSWLDAPCYFGIDDGEGRFYELSENVLRQSAPQSFLQLSEVS